MSLGVLPALAGDALKSGVQEKAKSTMTAAHPASAAPPLPPPVSPQVTKMPTQPAPWWAQQQQTSM
jgi:hypothetical protein